MSCVWCVTSKGKDRDDVFLDLSIIMSYEDYCKGLRKSKASKTMDDSSPTMRFLNRYPNKPESDAELREQQGAAVAFKKEGDIRNEDVEMWEKLSTEAKENNNNNNNSMIYSSIRYCYRQCGFSVP